MTKPIFTFSIVPKMNVCEQFATTEAPWHARRRFDTYVVSRGGKIQGMVCTYCFIAFVADVCALLKNEGVPADQIKLWLPDGPSNKANVDGIRKVDRQETRARREEKPW